MSGTTRRRGEAPAARPESLRRTLALLVLDIGAPIGVYYGLTGVGYPPWWRWAWARWCPPWA